MCIINYQFSNKQMNETLQTIKARRSVRAYTEQQVSAEDLNGYLCSQWYAFGDVALYRHPE